MSGAHVDFERFVKRGAALPSLQERSHLDGCAACRRRFQAFSQAERALGGDADLPSSAQADAVLEAVLDRAPHVAPSRPLLARLWLPALTAAGLALLVGVPYLLPPAESEEGFQERGGLTEAEVGVRAYCVTEGRVQPIAAGGDCPATAKISVSVFIRPQLPSRARLYLVDRRGHLLRAHSGHPDAQRRGIAVGVPGADPVIDAYLDLAQASLGAWHIVVALCSDCSSEDVEREILADAPRTGGAAPLEEVRIERLPVQIVEELR